MRAKLTVSVDGTENLTAWRLLFPGATIVVTDGTAEITVSGGGGATNHATLTHLGWTASGHTGTHDRIAGFDGAGAATFYTGSQVVGFAATTAGDLLYGDGAGGVSRLPIGSANRILSSSGTAPQWWTGADFRTAITDAYYQPLNASLTAISGGTWTGAASITTLGTVATGTWAATTITSDHGGTGLTSWTAGDIPYYSAGTALSKLAIGTNGYLLGISGGVPAWRSPANAKTDLSLNNVENTALSTWPGSTNVTTLGTIATGTWNATAIGPTYGGTGIATYTTGDLIYASASDTLAKLAIGGSAYFLGSNGTTPGWRQPSDVRSDLGLVIGTNVQAYDAGLTSLTAADASAGLPYVSGANTWATATYTAMLSIVSGAWKVIGWRESGGQDLTNGAIADGQLMARVGTTVAGVDVGATPAASRVVKSGSDGYIDRGWLPAGKYPFADPTKFLYYYWTVSAGSMIYNGPTPTTAGSSVVFSDTTSGIQFTSTGTGVFSGWNTGTTNATTRLGHNGTTSYLIQMSSDLTNQRMRIGLYTGTPGNNDTPGASGYYLLFRYSTSAGDTKWQIVHGTSTGYTVTDTGVTVTASKTYLFTLTTSSSGVTYTVLEDPHGAATNTYTGAVTSNNPTSSTNIGLTAYIVSTTASSHNYVFYGALYQAAQP